MKSEATLFREFFLSLEENERHVTGTVLLWNRGVNWVDLVVLAVFYVPCGLGITVGWHRYFAHKSFETNAPVKALLAILGSMAMQGPRFERLTSSTTW